MTNQVSYDSETNMIHAEIDFEAASPDKGPPLDECRFAVLQIVPTHVEPSKTRAHYVIYDRLLNRIVDGVYWTTLEDVLEIARHFNEHPDRGGERAPNGDALGLRYP